MNITKDFIVDELKNRISAYKAEVKEQTIGRVVEVGDGIARISGLSDVMMSEMIEIESSAGVVSAVVLNLEEESVGAVILGDSLAVKEGDKAVCLKRILDVPVGEALVGRVVDPLGRPLDAQGDIKTEKRYPVEKIAPGVITRQSVTQPVQTGIKAIDAMVPIGRGQRELIIW